MARGDGSMAGTSNVPKGWEPSPVVYVVQEDAAKNMTSALRYGSCEALLQQREEATMLNINTIIKKITRGLRDFTPQDYLLLSGSPVSIGIACSVAAEKTGGFYNVLKWDGQERCYWLARIDLSRGE